MSKPNDGGPAFPLTMPDYHGDVPHITEGMSLRDWFAGQALQKASGGNDKSAAAISARAYYIADAMLAARKETDNAHD